MVEHSQILTAIRSDVADLGRRMDEGFAMFGQRLTSQWVLGVQMTMFAAMLLTWLKR
jgi:hypothetical protein